MIVREFNRRALFVALAFAVILPLQAHAYNKPWDQGHRCTNVNTPDGLWGRFDYDGHYHGDHTSKECCELLCKICPVYVNTGRLQKAFTDLSVPGKGPSLAVTRTYQSQEWATSLFGRGWIFNFGRRLIVSRSKDGEKIVGIIQETGERNYFKENTDGTLVLLAEYGVTYSLSKNPDGTYVIAEQYGRVQHVNAEGKLLTIADKNGNQLTFEYDAVGCLSRIMNASGNYVDVQLGPNGKIASISDNLGRTVQYAYDGDGNLISVTDPLGNSTQYTYDAENRLASIIDARGNTVLAVTYDSHQPPRIATFTEKGETWTINYYDGYTFKQNSSGHTWTYYFNDLGIIERTIDPLGNDVERQHNRVTSTSVDWEEDANGNRTTYTYEINGNISGKTDSLGNTWQYTYPSGSPRLETETDPLGTVIRYEYDSNGNQTKVINDLGGTLESVTTYTYDARGNITGITDPLGNTTQYEYDDEGNPTRIVNALGNVTSYSYDSRGNRLTETDALGSTTTYTYDIMGNILTDTDALGSTITYAYDENGNRTSATDADGNTTTYAYDAWNRLIRVTDPLGGTTAYTYDAEDNRTSMTDARGNTTAYSYDPLGRLVRETNALGGQTNYTYDAAGNVLTVTDACGNTTTYAYDAMNRKVSQTNAAGETTAYTYDAMGNLVNTTLPNGNVITQTYDALGRVVAVSDSSGAIASYTYDAAGRQLSATDALGNTTSNTYDAVGRVVQASDPMGNSTAYAYDALGRLTSLTDREGNVTGHTYDALGRRLSQTDALGNTTTYGYDSAGNLVSVTDALGNTTNYSYDALNRLFQETYADGTTRSFTYDAAGNQISRTDQKGQVTAYVYDALNRRTTVDYPGTNDSTFAYDCASNLATANNSAGTISFGYDNIHRLTQSVQNGQTVTYAYDTAAGTMTIFYPGGRVVKNVGNIRGQLIRVEDASAQPILQYAYDAAGRLQTKAYVHGVTGNFTHNVNGWTTQLTYDSGGSQTLGFEYGFDKEGNRLYARKLHDTGNSEQYLYDAKYRLVQFRRGTLDAGGAVPTPATQTAYNLDALGNWTSTTTDAVTENRTHNNMNELISIDGSPLTYDDNGNLIDDGTNTYEYDYENRLASVIRNSDSTVLGEYSYDALGQRVGKSVGGTTTEYVYHQGQVLQERTGGTVVREYAYGALSSDKVAYDSSADYYYLPNSLGSIAAVSNSSGAIIETYLYDPYGEVLMFDGGGNPISASAVSNAYMFAGMQYDSESEFYHTLYRKYSAGQGRFTTHDPIQRLNRYEYAASNPANLIDPLGLWEKKPGTQNIWVVDDGDTLWNLAVNVSRDGYDWECIWPKQMRSPSNQYWLTLRKCDEFDVSNLTARSGGVLEGIMLNPGESGISCVQNLLPTASNYAGNASGLAQALKTASGEGATPLFLFRVAGHSGTSRTINNGNTTGNNAFSVADLTAIAISSQSYVNASAKKGPIRCWFTRNAIVRGFGCSSKYFAEDFANQALRGKRGSGVAWSWGTTRSVTKTETCALSNITDGDFWTHYTGGL